MTNSSDNLTHPESAYGAVLIQLFQKADGVRTCVVSSFDKNNNNQPLPKKELEMAKKALEQYIGEQPAIIVMN